MHVAVRVLHSCAFIKYRRSKEDLGMHRLLEHTVHCAPLGLPIAYFLYNTLHLCKPTSLILCHEARFIVFLSELKVVSVCMLSGSVMLQFIKVSRYQNYVCS